MKPRTIESEQTRRIQLAEATIHEIGEAGSLNVTVGKIAKRAGVSSGLAFHYFGDKTHLFLAAMRHVMSLYSAEVRGALLTAQTPRDRLTALIGANFSTSNFRPEVISAWLNFYVLAQSSEEARRLLAVYHRRLQSNLVHDLRPLVGDKAPAIADRIGGLIDGLYLRSATLSSARDGRPAMNQVLATLEAEIEHAK
ncbi:transcriptional regulator BetI [Pseudooceanicola sp. MF1-13]|uniref:transcriptional regulator BetI n=1 Tax=Pseudooceanicola sp. MF1-13 TaxID=3379095 RepID=UPI00389214E1